jgi:hypothetical protein
MADGTPKSAVQIGSMCADLDNMAHFVNRIEHDLQDAMRDLGEAPAAQSDRSAAETGIWKPGERLPYLYRGSVLQTVLGFFEHNLNELCNCLRVERGIEERITDLPGKGLRRAKLYMAKYIGVDFPADTDAWKHVLKYADIRNLIAHRDGLVKDDDPELIRFIENNPCMSIDDTHRVCLHEGFLTEVIDQLHRFFEILSERIAALRR